MYMLISLSDEYIEKVFYFCLKKTGDRVQTEDLASEIFVDILTALDKGTIPTSFSAWVWRIARNRFSKWVANRYNANFYQTEDINEIEITSTDNVENEIIQQEDISLLRRELALIVRDYREIVVAFYIDGKNVAQISSETGLSEGTVKTRLFKSRKLLTEGMKMAREFGVRSYKPDNVNFFVTGNVSSGLPWKAVERKLSKNILLEAHNNPSTLSELSIEIGIAMPYLEEEVGLLVEATLMKNLANGKYITNFFIADSDCQTSIYKIQRQGSKERNEILDKILTDSMIEIKKLGIIRNNMTDDDFKWLTVLRFIDHLLDKSSIKSACEWESTKRPHNVSWDFLGFEICSNIREKLEMVIDGWGENDCFTIYRIPEYNMENRPGKMTWHEAEFFADIIKNKRKADSFTEFEKINFQGINNRFAHIDKNGDIIPDIAIFEGDTINEFYNILEKHHEYALLLQKYVDIFLSVKEFLEINTNKVLHEQLNYYVKTFMNNLRMMHIYDEIETGRLIIPMDLKNSTVAMCFELV